MLIFKTSYTLCYVIAILVISTCFPNNESSHWADEYIVSRCTVGLYKSGMWAFISRLAEEHCRHRAVLERFGFGVFCALVLV